MNIQFVSSEAQDVLTLGREHWWGFRVAEGHGIFPQETYQLNWWYVPTNDSIQMPEADKRIEAIKKDHEILQVVIAHEAPPLLGAPQNPSEEPTRRLGVKNPLLGVVAGLGAIIMVGVSLFAVFSMMYFLLKYIIPIMGLFLMVGVLGVGVLIDPAVIVVLKEGSRIEVIRWLD